MTTSEGGKAFAEELQRAIRQFGDRTWTSQAMTDRILSLHEKAVAAAVREARIEMARKLCGVNLADVRPCVDHQSDFMCPVCKYALSRGPSK